MALSKEITNLSGQLNHDLREPINSIRRKLELLKISEEYKRSNSKSPEGLAAFTEIVSKQCDRLIGSIRSLRNEVLEQKISEIEFLERLDEIVGDASKLSGYVMRIGKAFDGVPQVSQVRTTALRFQKMLRALVTIARPETPVFSQTNFKNQAHFAASYVTERLPDDLKVGIDSPFVWDRSRASAVADQGMFLTIFQNIYDNCVKYRSDDRPLEIMTTFEEMDGAQARRKFRLKKAELPLNGRHIVIRISDNGIGMKKGDTTKIFEAYHQLKGGREKGKVNTTTDDATASVADTGIGLYTVRKLVAQHAGYVLAQSNASFGATITVIVPADPNLAFQQTS